MTETEEQELLVAAKRRHEEKAAQTRIEIAPRAGDKLEAALGRLNSLPPMHRGPLPDTERDGKVKELIVQANLPARHNRAIARVGTPWQAKLDGVAARLGQGFLVALVGVQGTGKTQLACALVRAAAEKSMPGRFATAMDFFLDLKATFDDGKATELAAIKAYARPKVLVLDEMDERSESAWENRLLFHLVNKRYNALLDTVLISRRSKAEFLASVEKSIQSRLQETGGVIECNWGSFRG